MYLFESLKDLVSRYLPADQVEQIERAYITARDAHSSQSRSSGEPYITHPVAVAHILAEMRLDHETLMAALLHDVIEDTPITKEQLASLYGPAVAELVSGVSKLDKLKFRDHKEAQVENFRKMFLAMVQDIRVILIKLADRTHNMRTLGSLRPDKRRRIARETLEIFAPIANRLGIHSIKNELEELGLDALYPMRSRVLREAIKRARGNRKDAIEAVLTEIRGRLQEVGIKAEVYGREKHIFSIYNKMVKKEVQFHEVMDIYAFRVVVQDIDTCYRVLGQMHTLYKPRPGRFKDYIAIPKTNGYQSLHTSLVGPRGMPVEVQIRTEFMDQMADKGVAAHWVYKQDGDNSSTTAQLRAQRWMKNLLELQQSVGSSFEFIESVKTDLFPEEIYVFTPDGRILELPASATAVDFAYAVHTDVGNACIGARVDRHPYPLSRALVSGQTIEILTSPNGRPNAAWLNFVVTSRARTKIRQYLKNLRSEESILLGRRLLVHALGGKRIEDMPPENVKKVLQDTKHETLDGLLADIGLGNAMSVVIARRLMGNADELNIEHALPHHVRKLPIKGADGMLVTFANCCRPIPGDHIIAHISPGKGLVIHTDNCRNIRGYSKEPDKYLPVQWDLGVSSDHEFRTGLQIELVNHQGVLAQLANTIAATGANIQGISTEEKDGRVYQVNLLITTKSRVHLAEIMRKIRVMPDVMKVSRNRG